MEKELVLDQKALIPILEGGSMSPRMIADYYHINYALVVNRYNYYKKEFSSYDTVYVKNSHDFEAMIPEGVRYTKNTDTKGYRYCFSDGGEIVIGGRQILLLSARAIEHLFYLINAKPAHNKRENNINNDERHLPVKINHKKKSAIEFESSEEKNFCLNLAKAYASGDLMSTLAAALALDGYRKRKINGLEEENKELQLSSGGIMWNERSSARKMIQTISDIVNEKQSEIWNVIYYKLIHKYGIPLERRNKKPLIDGLESSEWYLFYQSVADLCEERYLNMSQIYGKAGINTEGLSLVMKF